MDPYTSSLNLIMSSVGMGNHIVFNRGIGIKVNLLQLGIEEYVIKSISTVIYEVPTVLLESINLHDKNSLSSPDFIDIQAELFPVILLYLYSFRIRDMSSLSVLLGSLDPSQLRSLRRSSIQLDLEGLVTLCDYPFMDNEDFFGNSGIRVPKGIRYDIIESTPGDKVYLPDGAYVFLDTNSDLMIIGSGINRTFIDVRSNVIPSVKYCTLTLPYNSRILSTSIIVGCRINVHSRTGITIEQGSNVKMLRTTVESKSTCISCTNCILELLFCRLIGTLGILSFDSRINMRSVNSSNVKKLIQATKSDIDIGIEGQDDTKDIDTMVEHRMILDQMIRLPSVPPELYSQKTL